MDNSPITGRRSVWDLARFSTIFLYIVVTGLFAAGVIILGEDILQHIDTVEQWVTDMGPWALPVFVLLYAALCTIFVPDMVLGIIAGTTLGFTRGVIAATLGSLIGAALQYALSRRLLKSTVNRFLSSRPALAAIQVAVKKQEFRLQFLIRLTPLNRSLTNYTLGACDVGFLRFIVACVGFLPSLILEVYIGYTGKQMVEMASQPARTASPQEIVLIVGLAAAVVVMVVISRTARRAVEAAEA